LKRPRANYNNRPQMSTKDGTAMVELGKNKA
jgi:hypothetical protein